MLFMSRSSNIVCMINSAVITADLCHNLLSSPLRSCSWAVRERWVDHLDPEPTTMKAHKYLFLHNRISKVIIFFLLASEDVQLC